MKVHFLITFIALFFGCCKPDEKCENEILISKSQPSSSAIFVGMPFEFKYKIEISSCEKYNGTLESELKILIDENQSGNFILEQSIPMIDTFNYQYFVSDSLLITINKSGSYMFQLCTDLQNKIMEVNEANNCL